MEELGKTGLSDRRELGIYVHIPFCAGKCAYCDFLSFPAGLRTQEKYFRVLRQEIASFDRAGEYEAVTVYFGGGTPSLPSSGEITKTLDVIHRTFSVSGDAEITIECNPGTLNGRKLEEYRSAGFNRLSIGLQSSDNALLKKLGRIHTWERFLKEYHDARAQGFENISVDLMYALPGQTLSQWEDTLGKVTALSPEHISAYSLIIEEGTAFWESYHEDDETRRRGGRPLFLPDEEDERRMLEVLNSSLQNIGMYRYEISSYALPGRESRHNTGYWIRREYAGFGLGASGQIGKKRYRNRSDMTLYLEDCSVREEETVLQREDEIAETMILGLRMTEGVDLRRFEQIFHVRAQDLYKEEIQKFRQAGLLELSKDHMYLTDRGLDVSNLVMCAFL